MNALYIFRFINHRAPSLIITNAKHASASNSLHLNNLYNKPDNNLSKKPCNKMKTNPNPHSPRICECTHPSYNHWLQRGKMYECMIDWCSCPSFVESFE